MIRHDDGRHIIGSIRLQVLILMNLLTIHLHIGIFPATPGVGTVPYFDTIAFGQRHRDIGIAVRNVEVSVHQIAIRTIGVDLYDDVECLCGYYLQFMVRCSVPWITGQEGVVLCRNSEGA